MVSAWVETTDGLTIRVAHWGADAPRGTVLLFPGRTEYIEKYGLVAAGLRARGYATATVDWRGQGLSGRIHPKPELGHVGAFRDYQADVLALLEFVRAENLPEPYYLLAHSMGGCIGLRSLQGPLPVKAVAFSAPMWGIQMTASLRSIAWSLSTASRHLGFGNLMAPGQAPQPYVLRVPFEGNTLTSDREMWDRLGDQISKHPELALGGPTLTWLNEALVEMRGLARRPSPDYPTRCWLGTEEAIVDPARVHRRMDRWPGGRLDLLEGCRHETLMESEATRTRILDTAAAHFAAHR